MKKAKVIATGEIVKVLNENLTGTHVRCKRLEDPVYNDICWYKIKEIQYNDENMKEFNLELAKANHPVETNTGSEARIICYDRDSEYNLDERYPIVALVRVAGIEKIIEYTKKGVAKQPGFGYLVMATTKKEGWVNIYKGMGGSPYTGNIYPSEEDAIKHIPDYGDIHLATKKLEWEE